MVRLVAYLERGSSGSSVPDYSSKGTGFEPHAGRPLLGSPSLNGYLSMTGNLNTAKKGTGHPTSLCRGPSLVGVAMCLGLVLEILSLENRYGRAGSPSHLVCMILE